MDNLKKYVEYFNSVDDEIYKNQIDNSKAYEWMKSEIPLFECPDKDIEKTYYYRYWTYRKHVRATEEGYVITEFLPKVPWSGKHNTINAAVGHHVYEGRWLKNSKTYIGDYIKFFFNNPERAHHYSAWLCYAVLKFVNTTGDDEFGRMALPNLCSYYEVWENTHGLENGMFWSVDMHDAMEYSISGCRESDLKWMKGIRPTLNCYMCADAFAIAELAKRYGEAETENKYRKKYEELRAKINEKLFEDGFYRSYHYDDGEDISTVIERGQGKGIREEIGYIPWMFNIPEKGREDAFELLTDENSFYTDFGIATAERSHPRFLYEVHHECLWNGYVWPFATSQTLNALRNVIDYYGGDKYKKMYCDLLAQYARSHVRTKDDGQVIPWIDEVRHPIIDDWSSRTVLKSWDWTEKKGGYERGKDYNHSTFCDLVISGIAGVCTDENSDTIKVSPCIPDDWDWFRLSRLPYRGKMYDIIYDKTGEKYGMGKGLIVKEI